jgi:hypothetical protein
VPPPRNTRAPAAKAPASSDWKKNAPAGKTPSPRGLEHFVAVALPNIPIRALKLGDRIPLTGVARGHPEGLRCARSLSYVVPLVRFGRVSEPGRRSKSIFWLSVGPTPRGLAHFMAAALPKIPMHALKLGDRISPTGVARGRAAGYRYARSSSDMAPPVRFGEVV